jgi:hypothetical protein
MAVCSDCKAQLNSTIASPVYPYHYAIPDGLQYQSLQHPSRHGQVPFEEPMETVTRRRVVWLVLGSLRKLAMSMTLRIVEQIDDGTGNSTL